MDVSVQYVYHVEKSKRYYKIGRFFLKILFFVFTVPIIYAVIFYFTNKSENSQNKHNSW